VWWDEALVQLKKRHPAGCSEAKDQFLKRFDDWPRAARASHFSLSVSFVDENFTRHIQNESSDVGHN